MILYVQGCCVCSPQRLRPRFLRMCPGAGRGCRVMCTQPRRISAISIAERVAAERGDKCGNSIGYTIRLDTKWVPMQFA